MDGEMSPDVASESLQSESDIFSSHQSTGEEKAFYRRNCRCLLLLTLLLLLLLMMMLLVFMMTMKKT